MKITFYSQSWVTWAGIITFAYMQNSANADKWGDVL